MQQISQAIVGGSLQSIAEREQREAELVAKTILDTCSLTPNREQRRRIAAAAGKAKAKGKGKRKRSKRAKA